MSDTKKMPLFLRMAGISSAVFGGLYLVTQFLLVPVFSLFGGSLPTPPKSKLYEQHITGSNGPEGYSNVPSITVTAFPMPPSGCLEKVTNDLKAPRVCAKTYRINTTIYKEQRLVSIDPSLQYGYDHNFDMRSPACPEHGPCYSLDEDVSRNSGSGTGRYYDHAFSSYARKALAEAYARGDYRPPAWLTDRQKMGILHQDAEIPGLIWRQRMPFNTIELWTNRNGENNTLSYKKDKLVAARSNVHVPLEP